MPLYRKRRIAAHHRYRCRKVSRHMFGISSNSRVQSHHCHPAPLPRRPGRRAACRTPVTARRVVAVALASHAASAARPAKHGKNSDGTDSDGPPSTRRRGPRGVGARSSGSSKRPKPKAGGGRGAAKLLQPWRLSRGAAAPAPSPRIRRGIRRGLRRGDWRRSRAQSCLKPVVSTPVPRQCGGTAAAVPPRDRHDPVLAVTPLLPIIPIRHTIFAIQSLQVGPGRSQPYFKTILPFQSFEEQHTASHS